MLIDSAQQLLDAACQVPIQNATTRLLAKAGVELLVRRDDQLDSLLSGNKFYKLFFNLQAAHAQGIKRVISFGGPYSNHLHALAAAARRYNFEAIGVVRGDRPECLSPTLIDAEAWGMKLVFVGRGDYDRKTEQEWLASLQSCYGELYLIPEGGANLAGVQGMTLLGHALEQQSGGDYTAACIAVGTGTSLAGLAAGINPLKIALGFSVLKGTGDLGAAVNAGYRQVSALPIAGRQSTEDSHLHHAANWRLISGFHGGGYAKKPAPNLFQFWQDFERETGIPLDPVYTLKMFWGISCLAQQGYWARGSRLIAIHSGGLQGRRGFLVPDNQCSP